MSSGLSKQEDQLRPVAAKPRRRPPGPIQSPASHETTSPITTPCFGTQHRVYLSKDSGGEELFGDLDLDDASMLVVHDNDDSSGTSGESEGGGGYWTNRYGLCVPDLRQKLRHIRKTSTPTVDLRPVSYTHLTLPTKLSV